MPPRSKIGGHIVFVLSVILSFCPSVWNFNLAYNFWMASTRDLIFHMCIPHHNTFPLVPKLLTFWPSPWCLTYFKKKYLDRSRSRFTSHRDRSPHSDNFGSFRQASARWNRPRWSECERNEVTEQPYWHIDIGEPHVFILSKFVSINALNVWH